MLMLFLGRIISVSANSWLGVWSGLEINLMSFIPLIRAGGYNLSSSEASLNYFLVQVISSCVFLFIVTLVLIFSTSLFFYFKMRTIYIIALFFLILKLGAAPFHFWFPNVRDGISWFNNIILITWQKLAPIRILSYFVEVKLCLLIFAIFSVFIGALGGLNQLSLRKLLAFSSINHVGWMLFCVAEHDLLWFIYFFVYSFIRFGIIIFLKLFNLYYLSQVYFFFSVSYSFKFFIFISILSLAGLPPFLGFFPKLCLIESLSFQIINFRAFFIVLMRLVTLYYYFKIGFSAYFLSYLEGRWIFSKVLGKLGFYFTIFFNFLSLFIFFFVVKFFIYFFIDSVVLF